MEMRQASRSLACSLLFVPGVVVIAAAGVGLGASGVGSVCREFPVLVTLLPETADSARILTCSVLSVPSIVVVAGAGVGLDASGVGSVCKEVPVFVTLTQETTDSARIIDRSNDAIWCFIL
jgi:GH24 family phage-related lysozyme (muramidase)